MTNKLQELINSWKTNSTFYEKRDCTINKSLISPGEYFINFNINLSVNLRFDNFNHQVQDILIEKEFSTGEQISLDRTYGDYKRCKLLLADIDKKFYKEYQQKVNMILGFQVGNYALWKTGQFTFLCKIEDLNDPTSVRIKVIGSLSIYNKNGAYGSDIISDIPLSSIRGIPINKIIKKESAGLVDYKKIFDLIYLHKCQNEKEPLFIISPIDLENKILKLIESNLL
jgi:hypothetical protein